MNINRHTLSNPFILLYPKFKYRSGITKYYRIGLRFHETYFDEMKNKKPYEHPNS